MTDTLYPARKFGSEGTLDEMPDTMPVETDEQSANDRRAIRAGMTVGYYATLAGDQGEPTETIICDLLADLLHLCDATDVDFSDALHSATTHHYAEVRGQL